MKQGYPFQPLVDSLIGECMKKSWMESGHLEEELNLLLKKSIFNTDSDEFNFTPNIKKEILLGQVPQEIRSMIQVSDWKGIVDVLRQLGQGKYENQESNGLDLSFELIEWLVSGFDDEINLLEIFQNFFLHDPRINDDFTNQLKKNYFLIE